MLSSLKARLNHRLARIDAGEMIKHAQPLRKYATAPVGLGLGIIAAGYNAANAYDSTSRRKGLIRDSLVILGVGLMSVLASRIVHRPLLKSHKHALPHKWTHDIIDGWNKIVRKQNWSKKFELHEHHHHAPLTEFSHDNNSPIKRLKSLFGHTMHSHGIEGSLNLTLLSALPIFLGGVPFGTLADKINGEDWSQTAGLKIKEGLFQFIGNITMCTVAILAFTNGSVALTRRLWDKFPALKARFIKNTAKKLEKLNQLPDADLRKVSGKLTQVVEHTLIKQGENLANIQTGLVDDLVAHTFKNDPRWAKEIKPLWKSEFEPRLIAALQQGKAGRAEIRKTLQEFFGKQMSHDAQWVLTKDTQGNWLYPEALAEISKSRMLAQGEIAGVVPGVAAGVFGGAIASNGINSVLTRWLGLPEHHTINGFFDHHHHSPAHQKHDGTLQNLEDDGWLAGKLGGPRGLHWFDWMLHLDDAPSAFYLMGVEALESVIQVLYGISGFIAGTAGTDYSQPPGNNKPFIPTVEEWIHQHKAQSTGENHLWQLTRNQNTVLARSI